MAPVVAKKGSSTSKIAPEPSAPTGRIGSSKEVSCKSEPSGMASKSEPPGTALPAPRPFLSISNDLCGLVISSWLVPTVRRPRKGVLTFVGALLAQLGFLLYMVEIIIHGGKSTCETPALLQLVALYTFGSACAAGSHSDNLLQVALVCQRLRLPAAPVADSHGRLTQGSEGVRAAAGECTCLSQTTKRASWGCARGRGPVGVALLSPLKVMGAAITGVMAVMAGCS